MITLLSYTEGCFGEFMCSSVANDSNYYKGKDSKFIENRNSYSYYDIIKEEFNSTFDLFSLNSKCDFKEETLHQIKELYNEKHICARTHGYDFGSDWDPILNSEIININKVKMFVTEEQYVFALFMVMIKAHMPFENTPMWPLSLLTDKNSSIRVPNVDYSCLEDADPDQYVNFIKWVTIRHHGSEKTEYIAEHLNNYFQWYKKNSTSGQHLEDRKPGWTYLNVYDLLSNPEQAMPEWKEKLHLADNFDFDRIKQYQANNHKVLYNGYNLTFDQLKEVDWKKILIDRAVSLYDTPLKKRK